MTPGDAAAAPAGARRPVEPFRTDHLLQGDLVGRFARGGAVALCGQGARAALHLAALLVLARLLTPRDFGLVAMVAPIVSFVGLFKDLGLTAATVQRQEVTSAQAATLFWINAAVSAALALACAALAPAVAAFYGDPRLVPLTVALGALVLPAGLAAQHLALLQRQMRFATLAGIEVAATATGVAAALAGAWAGLGHWALVLLPAGSALASLVLVWSASGWRPGRPARGTGVRPMLRFGGGLTGATICQHLNRNLDNVLIGKAWGDAALGLYSRAYGLLLLPISQLNTPVSGVAVPVLSRLQDDPVRYRAHYLDAIGLLAGIGMPLVAFATLEARGLILLLLGPQWLGAVPIFQALAPAAFLGTFNVATGWVYVTLGRTGRQLRWALMQTPAILAAFLAGLPYGPVGVAVAYSLAMLALRPVAVAYCFRGTPLRPADLWRALLPPAAASVGAAAALAAARAGLGAAPGAEGLPALVLAAAAYGLLYLLLTAALPGGRRNLAALPGLVRRLGLPLPWPRRLRAARTGA